MSLVNMEHARPVLDQSLRLSLLQSLPKLSMLQFSFPNLPRRCSVRLLRLVLGHLRPCQSPLNSSLCELREYPLRSDVIPLSLNGFTACLLLLPHYTHSARYVPHHSLHSTQSLLTSAFYITRYATKHCIAKDYACTYVPDSPFPPTPFFPRVLSLS